MGNIITKDGMKPDPDNISSIVNVRTPTNKAATRRFLGMMTYLSKYCPSISRETKPLRDVSNNLSEFTWGHAQDEAFTSCKSLITQAPTLQYFDTNTPVVQVDASEDGMGGAILQPNGNGDLQPVAYTSSSLTKTEQRYAQIEKETLAICAAFAKSSRTNISMASPRLQSTPITNY
jgi:hypothetical protein